MKPFTESMFQNWRALARNFNGNEHLLCLGGSYSQIKTAYAQAFRDVLTEDEQWEIKKIELQRWSGTADCGNWLVISALPIPETQPAVACLAG
jgi:hypothetical protein